MPEVARGRIVRLRSPKFGWSTGVVLRADSFARPGRAVVVGMSDDGDLGWMPIMVDHENLAPRNNHDVGVTDMIARRLHDLASGIRGQRSVLEIFR